MHQNVSPHPMPCKHSLREGRRYKNGGQTKSNTGGKDVPLKKPFPIDPKYKHLPSSYKRGKCF